MFHPMGLKSGYMTVTPPAVRGVAVPPGIPGRFSLLARSCFSRLVPVGMSEFGDAASNNWRAWCRFRQVALSLCV